MNTSDKNQALLQKEVATLRAEIDRLKAVDQSVSTEHRALQLQTVADISRATSSILNLSELLSTTVDVIRNRFKLSHVAIFLIDETKKYALLRASTGETGRKMLSSGYKFDIEDSSLISRCISDCQAHIAFYEGKDGAKTGNHLLPKTRSEILLPLAHQGNTIGVMTIQSIDPAAFTFEDIPVYQTMADQVSNAIENARLFEQTLTAHRQAEARLRDMQIMQRISSAVSRTFDLEKVIDALFAALQKDMGFTFIALHIIDETAKKMHTVRAVGLAHGINGLVRPLDGMKNDILLDVIAKGAIEVIDGWDDRFDKEIFEREGHGTLVRAFIPLLLREKTIGVLETGYNRKDHPGISPEEMRLLTSCAEQIAITFENTSLFDRLEHEHDLLHALMDNIPDAIYFKDHESRFLRVSRAMAKKMGFSDPGELIGKTDFDIFTKEHAQQAFNDEQKVIRTNRPVIGIEEKETWPDAHVTWVSTTKMPLHDKNRAAIGTFGVSRDITKRKLAEEALKFRVEFEKHITSVSTNFVNLASNQIDAAINSALRAIGEFTGADQCFCSLFGGADALLRRNYQWSSKGIEAVALKDASQGPDTFSWLIQKIKRFETVIMRSIEDLPAEARLEKQWFKLHGVRSFVNVPLVYGGAPLGFIGLESLRLEKLWSKDFAVLLTIIGEVFMNALERKRAEEELHNAKNMLEARVEERTSDLKKANELLESHIAQLNFLNTSFYELSPIIHLEKLLPAILNIFMARFPQALGSMCRRKKESFHCVHATGELGVDQGKLASEKAAQHIVRSDMIKPIFIADWKKDERLSLQSWPEMGPRPCYIAIPLIVDNKCSAILQIFAKSDYASVYPQERTVLATLAAHASICISNALHYQELGEKSRLDGELDAARSIQSRFTPNFRPQIPHVNLKGVYYPAYEVGGDYLDYFQTEAGNWVVVIADVCGKGIPAALLMTMLRSTFRVEARNESSARGLLCAVNQFMTMNLDERSFVTALCLIIDKNGDSMRYARAGHPMLVKMGTQGAVPENVACNGIALGLVQEIDKFCEMIEEIVIPLIKGERYLIYTDGLIDASDPQKNSYGFHRLCEVLARDEHADAEGLIAGLMDDIKSFTRGAAYHDDLTILALQVT
jgi:PAS domain S-box-containing protein